MADVQLSIEEIRSCLGALARKGNESRLEIFRELSIPATSTAPFTRFLPEAEVVIRSGSGSQAWTLIDLGDALPPASRVAYVRFHLELTGTGGGAELQVRPHSDSPATSPLRVAPLAGATNSASCDSAEWVALDGQGSRFEFCVVTTLTPTWSLTLLGWA